MRKWRNPNSPNSEEETPRQVIIPQKFREEKMRLGHAASVSNSGVKKTFQNILPFYFWPGIHKDVKRFCKTFKLCQIVGKPGDEPKPAPLHPIPVMHEPFSRVVVDIVGPLPKTRQGKEYLLTLMCNSTRYPEAIPISSIKARNLIPLIVDLFAKFGVPHEI